MRTAISCIGRLAFAGALIIGSLSSGSSESYAEEMKIGQEEFNRSCAVCHGEKGMGDGPFATLLDQKPANLTLLAKSNNGNFPLEKIYKTIDGRWEVNAHGPAEMPIWGDWYLTEAVEKYGMAQGPAEKAVRGRILELVYFIHSIQKD